MVPDVLAAHEVGHDRQAVLAQAELDEGVAARALGGAFAKEQEAPRVEARIQREAHPDRGLLAEERSQQHQRRPRGRPREGVPGREDAGVAAAGLAADAVLLLHDRDLAPVPREIVRGRDADDAAAEDQDLHRMLHSSRGARGVSSSQPSAVMATSSSWTIIFPGAYSIAGSMVSTIPCCKIVRLPDIFDGGSVSWRPRPCPSRPTLFPRVPPAESTFAMLRQTSSVVAPGRAALIPASVASQTISCACLAASGRSPTA